MNADGTLDYMFPALVGMNRYGNTGFFHCFHVPRTRGDEPLSTDFQVFRFVCSPHSWG